MEFIDKLVGWIVALSPVAGGAWVYLSSRRKKTPSEEKNDQPGAVIQGLPVTVDHTSEFLDFLKIEHKELSDENDKLKASLDAAHDLLRQHKLPIPP